MNDVYPSSIHPVGLRSGDRESLSVWVGGGGGGVVVVHPVFVVVVVRVSAARAPTVDRRSGRLAGRVPAEAQTATLQNDVYVLSAGGVGKSVCPDPLPRCVHKVTSQNTLKPQ